MGQFLQDEKMSVLCPFFSKNQSLRVTKPVKIDFILQLILDICILGPLKSLSVDLGKIFGVALDTLFLASLSDF